MARPKSGMKRVAFYLSPNQIERIQRLARKHGLPASEILRRAIDAYTLEREGRGGR